ncbi:hypothetical protein [Aeromicrobium alkaliterrae]|uniref:Secreted protein n=1 Tax=Aeromicrobium alkaliterrae TaxID=302168 RepID=A0ABN2JNR2_9ACTN
MTTSLGSPHRRDRLALALIAAALVVGGCSAPDDDGSEVTSSETAVDFPVNDRGQTYGSEDDASYDQRPDLLAVVATNGAEGFVVRDDLDEATGANVANPDEAVEWERTKEAGLPDAVLPVYASDGVTTIGEFVITY